MKKPAWVNKPSDDTIGGSEIMIRTETGTVSGGPTTDNSPTEQMIYGLEGIRLSIVVNIYYTGTNGNAGKFAEEMESSGTAAAIRREEGNLRYDYFFPMADPETVLLIDCWKNQKALDAHHASPMMEKITKLRAKYDLHMQVERYVSDENGMPESDRQFIRE